MNDFVKSLISKTSVRVQYLYIYHENFELS